MSLLHQNVEGEVDDAALGEELTKGTSHVVVASIMAAVLVTAAIVLFVWLGEKPPVATGELVEVWAHPRHVDTSGFDAGGAPVQVQHYDQVLLFAHVRVHNQSKIPLTMTDVLANVGEADGIHSITAGTKGQYEQVFVAYPEMAAQKQTGLSPTGTIAPGETVEGTLIWGLQMTKAQWDQRTSLDFSVRMQYQKSLKLTPAQAVGEK